MFKILLVFVVTFLLVFGIGFGLSKINKDQALSLLKVVAISAGCATVTTLILSAIVFIF